MKYRKIIETESLPPYREEELKTVVDCIVEIDDLDAYSPEEEVKLLPLDTSNGRNYVVYVDLHDPETNKWISKMFNYRKICGLPRPSYGCPMIRLDEFEFDLLTSWVLEKDESGVTCLYGRPDKEKPGTEDEIMWFEGEFDKTWLHAAMVDAIGFVPEYEVTQR
jgi:hypothetical protein